MDDRAAIELLVLSVGRGQAVRCRSGAATAGKQPPSGRRGALIPGRGIATAEREQLVVPTCLGDVTALIEDDDLVCPHNRGELVGDDQQSRGVLEGFQRRLNVAFVLGVERRGRFVEHHDRGPLEDGARNRESRRLEPLIEPALFRHPGFAGAVLGAVAIFVGFSMTLLLTTVLLQDTERWTPLAAGAATLPMAAGAITVAPVAGYLVGGVGPRIPMLASGVLLTLGGGLLTALTAGLSLPVLLTAYLLIGLGVGLGNPPITNTAVSSLPIDRSGVAGGITSTARQVGTALGVALAGTLAASGAMLLGWITVAACGTIVLAVATLAPGSGMRRDGA
ncbi:MFS transporter [Microbacterium sp.]|uniref:MFS transporter n=1 Tax=Microbacterium sp. TaxID=51671 RepID=UPI003C72188A